MFSLIGNLMASATKKFAAKPDPNVSDGGYRPRSQRARDAIGSMRQSRSAFAEQSTREEVSRIAQKQAAAIAKEKVPKRMFGSTAQDSSVSTDNAGYADGGVVSSKSTTGRCSSLYGKNMKK